MKWTMMILGTGYGDFVKNVNEMNGLTLTMVCNIYLITLILRKRNRIRLVIPIIGRTAHGIGTM